MKFLSGLLVALLAVGLLTPVALAEDPKPDFVVTFLMADSPTDKGWNFAHYRGIEDIKELGTVLAEKGLGFTVQLVSGKVVEVRVVENVGYDDASILRKAEAVVKEGANMVFGTWFNAKVISELADKYPDVLFEHCSGYPLVKNNGKNFSTYFIRMEQGDAVAGVAAARAGIKKVGLVSTFPIPEPVRGINGFIRGLQVLDPAATVRVVWVNSWLDAQGERMAAEGLMAEGYTVIRQMGDTPYASQAACETKGNVAIGYGSDVQAVAPCALITNEWNWGPYYKVRVQDAANGAWKPQDWWGGFPEGAIKMVGPAVASVQDIIDGFTNGTLNPFCELSGQVQVNGQLKPVKITGCLADMDLLTMQWYVNGYEGEYPDNQDMPVFGD